MSNWNLEIIRQFGRLAVRGDCLRFRPSPAEALMSGRGLVVKATAGVGRRSRFGYGMYVLKHGIKKNPQKRWALPDRIFFGHGACHILAGTFLELRPLEGFYSERIVPDEDFSGNHIYVTNGAVAFDYHGYSDRGRLLKHHTKGWVQHSVGWGCTIEKVDFDLLDTTELNQRKMLGPDQYLYDPVPRARRFIDRMDHAEAAERALRSA